MDHMATNDRQTGISGPSLHVDVQKQKKLPTRVFKKKKKQTNVFVQIAAKATPGCMNPIPPPHPNHLAPPRESGSQKLVLAHSC